MNAIPKRIQQLVAGDQVRISLHGCEEKAIPEIQPEGRTADALMQFSQDVPWRPH